MKNFLKFFLYFSYGLNNGISKKNSLKVLFLYKITSNDFTIRILGIIHSEQNIYDNV